MNAAAKWEKICPVEEIPVGTRKVFPLGALDILVFNTGKRFYASNAECFLGDSLEKAELQGHVVICAAHGCKIDLANGKCITDAGLDIPIFPVEVRDGSVWVKF